MYQIDLTGHSGVIFGVANDHSIAWGIAQLLGNAGAKIALTYQNERLKSRVDRLADTLDEAITLPCDASDDEQIKKVFEGAQTEFGDISFIVHSIAYANREDLSGPFSHTNLSCLRVDSIEWRCCVTDPLAEHGIIQKITPQPFTRWYTYIVKFCQWAPQTQCV